MKTVTTTVYEFSELSEQAQENALENYANSSQYFWGGEAIETLSKGADYFGSKLLNYSIDWMNPSQSTIIFNEVDELTKTEIKSLIKSAGKYNSKTFKGIGECKLTGVDHDENFLDGIRISFFKNGETDINELLKQGAESLLIACEKDYEYQLSKEAYTEHCQANGYEFTEEGELI